MSVLNEELINESGLLICQILAPVILSSIYTCLLINILDRRHSSLEFQNQGGSLLFFSRAFEGIGVNQEPSFLNSIYVVLIFCAIIVAITLLILLIFYLKWHNCLTYYFYIPTIFILTLVTVLVFREILVCYNDFIIDIFTAIILTWNFAALGLMAIFGLYAKTGLCLQQFYLVHNSAVVAVVIIHILPGWAPWLLLGFLVLWDLFAVLTPFGPLNLILDMAEKRGIVQMPGLIYSTDTTQQVTRQKRFQNKGPVRTTKKFDEDDETSNHSGSSSKLAHLIGTIDSDVSPNAAVGDDTERHNSEQQPEPTTATENVLVAGNEVDYLEETGLHVGLGDFVFYNLMVGLTSRFSDNYTTLAAVLSILVGIIITLSLLALTKRAIPAIPISISLALIVSVICEYTAPPFSNELASKMLFV